jgi:DNA-binding IclR family transcriptional regulator
MSAVQHRAAPKSVLERIFALLNCFTADKPELTLADLVSLTGLPKPTVHRLTRLLVEQRLLKRTDTGYSLGIRLFELGELVDDRRALRDASLPYLQELFERTHETIHLGVLEGGEVLYFTKIVGYKSFPLPTRTGGRWPAHASALGKILLAWTPDPLRSLPLSGLERLTPYTITDPGRLSRQLTRARRVRGPGGCPGQRLRGRTDLRPRRAPSGGGFRQRAAHASASRAARTDCPPHRSEYHPPHRRPDAASWHCYQPLKNWPTLRLKSSVRSIIDQCPQCENTLRSALSISSISRRDVCTGIT